MIFPVQHAHRISQGFSSRHPGIDIAPLPAGKTGVPCLAPENSTVSLVGYKPSLEGHYVMLRGDSGHHYYFGHFASKQVRTGQRIGEGQQIGVLGQTGKATGIHTHFEVRPTIAASGQINPLTINWEKEDYMSKLGREEITALFPVYFGYSASDEDHRAWTGVESNTAIRKFVASPQHKAFKKHLDDLRKAAASGGKVNRETVLAYVNKNLK